MVYCHIQSSFMAAALQYEVHQSTDCPGSSQCSGFHDCFFWALFDSLGTQAHFSLPVLSESHPCCIGCLLPQFMCLHMGYLHHSCGSDFPFLIHIITVHNSQPLPKMWCRRFIMKPFCFSPEGNVFINKSASLLCVFTYDILHSSLAAPSHMKW